MSTLLAWYDELRAEGVTHDDAIGRLAVRMDVDRDTVKRNLIKATHERTR